jgi:hypothetical protein
MDRVYMLNVLCIVVTKLLDGRCAIKRPQRSIKHQSLIVSIAGQQSNNKDETNAVNKGKRAISGVWLWI